MEGKQISFFEPTDKPKKKPKEKPETYDATICNKCLCGKCIYNVNIYPYPTKEELEIIKSEESCFNCDDCFYYGMDNEKLSKNIVKFKCSRFKKSTHYIEIERCHIELEAERRRKAFKII